MTILDIDQTQKNICQNLLLRASNVGRFTKKEFNCIDLVIDWFNNPTEDLNFDFGINYENNGESLSFSISFDGFAFTMEQSTYVVEQNYGGDRTTLYEYCIDNALQEESGDVFNFDDSARNLLNDLEKAVEDLEKSNVELSISIEEEY